MLTENFRLLAGTFFQEYRIAGKTGLTVANIPAKVFIVIYVLTNWSVKTNISVISAISAISAISVISNISNTSNTSVISDKSMILFLYSVSIFDILF